MSARSTPRDETAAIPAGEVTPRDRRRLLRAGAVGLLPALAVGSAVLSPTRASAASAPAQGGAAGSRHTRDDAVHWTRAYLDAWRSRDDEAVTQLFTPDACYEVVPGVAAQTYRGRAAIGRYWREVTAGQSDIEGRHGVPLVEGRRVVVELWVTLRSAGANPKGGDWITLIETNVLRFGAAGLCEHNAEYWNLQTGRLSPPAGWGGTG